MPKFFRLAFVFCAFAVLQAGFPAAAEGTSSPVRVAILNTVGKETSSAMFSSSLRALQKAWGRPAAVRYYDIPGLQEALKNEEADFFISNAGFFASQQSEGKARHLATLKIAEAKDPNFSMGGVFFVRNDSRIKSFEDMKGKTAVTVSPRAFGGYRISLGEIAKRGEDPENFFSHTTFIGYPMQRVFSAVQNGTADVGLVRACLIEEMIREKKIPADAFRVIEAHGDRDLACLHSTGLYPDWVFASVPGASPELSRKTAAALLSMPEENGVHWSIATNFQSVNDLFKTLKVEQYAYLRNTTLKEFVINNLLWFGAAGIIAFLVILHSVLVRIEVKRKTRLLRNALKSKERARRKSAETAERLRSLERVSLVGMLSNMVAHELKQPLGAISNFAGGIQSFCESEHPDREMIGEAAKEILEQTALAASIVDRVRGYAASRARNPEPVDLAKLAEKTLSEFNALSGKEHRIENRVPPGLTVTADAVELSLVILNLLKNAEAACRNVKKPQIAIRAQTEDGKALLCVEDNGQTANPEHLKNLFDPKISSKKDGLGLGLAISARLVEQAGGSLSLEPRSPSGVSAQIRLPLTEKEK